jgi:hypothetical protein
MAQHEDLDLFGPVTAEQEGKELEGTPQRCVGTEIELVIAGRESS